MLYKRDEPFRFTFGNPIDATFKILKINEISGLTKEGKAVIMDLSPNGVKLSSTLDLPITEKQFLLEISFTLNTEKMTMMAEPKWKKRAPHSSFIYGMVGLDDDETKKIIIEELKEYARKQHLK
jgi:hypothetical protein